VNVNDKDFERERELTFPKYTISIVTVITGVHAHTLRHYERSGLVEPSRTMGRMRRYSDSDLETIREIARLADLGINYAGIKEILRLRRQWHTMQSWPGDQTE